jgi:hypothetical protein
MKVLVWCCEDDADFLYCVIYSYVSFGSTICDVDWCCVRILSCHT